MVLAVWAKEFIIDKGQEHPEEESVAMEDAVHTELQRSSVLLTEPNPSLQEKIISILSSRSEGFTVSFAGMKRLLGDVHQQKLTKSIQRLLEARILQKNNEGYQLSPEFYQEGTSRLMGLRPREMFTKRVTASERRWLQRGSIVKGSFHLSKEMNPQQVYEQFKGRWFGRYRYVGGTVSNEWTSAEWISDDLHSYLRMIVKPREIIYRISNPRTGDEAALKTFLLKTVSKPFSVDLSLTTDYN